MLLTHSSWRLATTSRLTCRRAVSTLSNNPHIYVHSQSPTTHTLSFLSTSPPNGSLAIGTTTKLPPTPDTLKENHNFLSILQSVIKEHATKDPDVISQAAAYASTSGASLGSGGVFFPHHQQQKSKKRKSASGSGSIGGDGAGGASSQGGAGGAARGGHIHVSDMRNPPDYGRTAWPEDIFGSLEVDGVGNFVDDGRYQESGTYRVVTREGILNLSPYLRERLVERLKQLEAQGGTSHR